MKYKELFIEAQKKFALKSEKFHQGYFDIHSIVNKIDSRLDGRRREISPELYEDLSKDLEEIRTICGNQIYG